MRKITTKDRNRIAEAGKPKPAPVPTPATPPPNDNLLIKTQIEATLALTEVAAGVIDNKQLTEVIKLLSQPSPVQPVQSKRLTVNRDANGLIKSIDIEEI